MTGPDPAPLPQTTQVMILLRRSRTPLTSAMIAAWLGSHVQTIYHVMLKLKRHGYVTAVKTEGWPRYVLTETGITHADEIRARIHQLFTGDLP